MAAWRCGGVTGGRLLGHAGKGCQGAGDLGGRGGTLGRILGQHALQKGEKRGGHVGAELADRTGRPVLVGQQLLQRRAAEKRRLACEEKTKRAAQSINVGADVGADVDADVDAVGIVGLLWRGVVGRAGERAGGRRHRLLAAFAGQVSETEIEYLDLSRRGPHQVLRLDVAMDQTMFESVLQTEGRLPHIVAGFRHRQRSSLHHHAVQAQSRHVLHGEKVQIAGLFGIVGQGDVRMRESGDACASWRKRSTKSGRSV